MKRIKHSRQFRHSLRLCVTGLSLALWTQVAQAETTTMAVQCGGLPEKSPWQLTEPSKLGLNAQRIQSAINFAMEFETEAPRDQGLATALGFAREPYHDIIGPTTTHTGSTGLILYQGQLVGQWGNPDRLDMTHSVSKSLLSTVAAISFDRGLIPDLNAPVVELIDNELFASEHNSNITWDHLLRQTSSWEGELWGKPDWADRPVGDDRLAWPNRELTEPGTAWKYNDVRVNVLALALMQLWKQPLDAVLREHVMNRIGASASWQWHGYHNSWVRIDGRDMQSVSGGGHWGGGVFINAWDQARFGQLVLQQGCWSSQQVFSSKWYDYASTPTAANPGYGVMNWFLNRDQSFLPAASARSITHLGAGTNMVHVDPERELVIVARWIQRDAINGLIERVLAARNP